MSAATAQKPQAGPVLIVLGLDQTRKPHASVFGAALADGAQAAAKTMGMACLVVRGPELGQLAAGLPDGKLFGSGKAFVPFVKGSVFEAILKLAPPDVVKQARIIPAATPKLKLVKSQVGGGGSSTSVPSHGKPTARPEPHFPGDWKSIRSGSIVLAQESREEGWYEAIVMEVRSSDGLFDLQWEDWPDLPKFLRRPSEVALLPVPTPKS